jgi:hypothetical protein
MLRNPVQSMSVALDVVEKIRSKAREAPASQSPVQVITRVFTPPHQAEAESTWGRLAELLGLDRNYVGRVCSSSPEWCEWLYSAIMGAPRQVPGTTPTADILALIEHAERRGFRGAVQRLDIKELAKSVAEFAERVAKEFGRPLAEARQRAEEAIKAIRDVYGSRAQPAIEEEVFKRFRSMVQESTARDIAKATAKATVELPPVQAVERIEQLATAVRRAQAEAREEPPALKQAVQRPEQQQKPLRPLATAKQV